MKCQNPKCNSGRFYEVTATTYWYEPGSDGQLVQVKSEMNSDRHLFCDECETEQQNFTDWDKI